MKIRLGNWVGVHRTMGGLLHRIVHRQRTEACYVCEVVWRAMLAVPGFEEELRAAIAEADAGMTVPWAKVRERLG